MKKNRLILLIFVPILAGYLVNALILVPVLGMLLFYALPLLVSLFWFRLGCRFVHGGWRPLPAILTANAPGAVSLLLYLWQFLLETDETRSMFLAGLSQMFSASTPLYLFGRLAMLFESQPNYAGRTSMVAMQVIALVYMIMVFTAGVIREKR